MALVYPRITQLIEESEHSLYRLLAVRNGRSIRGRAEAVVLRHRSASVIEFEYSPSLLSHDNEQSRFEFAVKAFPVNRHLYQDPRLPTSP